MSIVELTLTTSLFFFVFVRGLSFLSPSQRTTHSCWL